MKKIFYGIVTIVLIINICEASDDSKKEAHQLFNKMRTGVVHIGKISNQLQDGNIAIDQFLGTGFLVDTTSTFVTAKHLFRGVDLDSIAIRLQLPHNMSLARTIKASVVHIDSVLDIAFLKLYQRENVPFKSKISYSFNLFNSEGFNNLTGKDVLVIGYPKVAQADFDVPFLRKGIISSTEIYNGANQLIVLDLIGVPGYSGSPVVLQDSGEVIGIIYGPGPTSRSFGFEWITPINQQYYNNVF